MTFNKEEFIKKKKKDNFLKKHLQKIHTQNTYKNKTIKKEFTKRHYNKQQTNTEQIHYYSMKRKEHAIYKIIDNMSSRVIKELKKLNLEKTFKYKDLFGCDSITLKLHLEKNFKINMTWDNYGDWQVDHILPVFSFNLANDDEMKKCFHYSNLQPLWKEENREKWYKIPEKYNQVSNKQNKNL